MTLWRAKPAPEVDPVRLAAWRAAGRAWGRGVCAFPGDRLSRADAFQLACTLLRAYEDTLGMQPLPSTPPPEFWQP